MSLWRAGQGWQTKSYRAGGTRRRRVTPQVDIVAMEAASCHSHPLISRPHTLTIEEATASRAFSTLQNGIPGLPCSLPSYASCSGFWSAWWGSDVHREASPCVSSPVTWASGWKLGVRSGGLVPFWLHLPGKKNNNNNTAILEIFLRESFIYLKDEREMEKHLLVHPQMAITASAEPGEARNQELHLDGPRGW